MGTCEADAPNAENVTDASRMVVAGSGVWGDRAGRARTAAPRSRRTWRSGASRRRHHELSALQSTPGRTNVINTSSGSSFASPWMASCRGAGGSGYAPTPATSPDSSPAPRRVRQHRVRHRRAAHLAAVTRLLVPPTPSAAKALVRSRDTVLGTHTRSAPPRWARSTPDSPTPMPVPLSLPAAAANAPNPPSRTACSWPPGTLSPEPLQRPRGDYFLNRDSRRAGSV
jgi:hypothetical protein